MLPVRVYAPRGKFPEGAVRVNVTSKATALMPDDHKSDLGDVQPFRALSPFLMGPVTVVPGKKALEALRMENGYQFTKLYQLHATRDGAPMEDHARWLLDGIYDDKPHRFPMGRGKKPLGAVWRNRIIGYVEARLRIYIPTYVEAICRDSDAFAAYVQLRELHARTSAAGQELALYDYDGYDHVKKQTTLASVAANDKKKMGHAFVLAALLENRLQEVVHSAAAIAGIDLPLCDLPTDLSPLSENERLPNLIGGAVIYHREEFLNHMADRYFDLFIPGGAANIPWERTKVLMMGREVYQKRDTAFFGDPGTSFRYSGRKHNARPWSDDPSGAVLEIVRIVRHVTGKHFNICLMNLYHPEDSIGEHSDDMRDLDEDSGIFSVSLGCTRTFKLNPRNGGGAGSPQSVELNHGSGVWMVGLTQRAYKHRVDPEKYTGTGPELRVNLTFRCTK